MNGPNRPAQPSLVTTAYLDEKLEQFARDLDVRFDQLARDLDVRLLKFENRLAWNIVGTIVAMTAIFSAVVLIAGVD